MAAASCPFICGMARSVMTTSNRPVWKRCRPSWPFMAVSTMCPSPVRYSTTTWRGTGSSSTTKTRSGRSTASTGAWRGATGRSAPPTGSRMRNDVPSPGWLSTSIVPR